MNKIDTGSVTLWDAEPRTASFRAEVVAGLSREPKTLPYKFLYDERGSALFDRICELDEYYPTRTELQIMRTHVAEMVACLGARCRLVEFGSGSSLKTRVLLDAARDLACYVPIDISRDHLLATAEQLAADYPDLPIVPVCADYGDPIPELPTPVPSQHTVVYFPGSTIGNFTRAAAVPFLRRIATLCGAHGGLLIGVDLVKDATVLQRAYDDAEGVTAQFNLNLLVRINRELDADFDLEHFRHHAFWDAANERVVIQILSTRRQTVHIGDHTFAFAAGEPITTEYSHKYTFASFAALAAEAGFEVQRVWTDEAQLFSVQYCETK